MSQLQYKKATDKVVLPEMAIKYSNVISDNSSLAFHPAFSIGFSKTHFILQESLNFVKIAFWNFVSSNFNYLLALLSKKKKKKKPRRNAFWYSIMSK